MNFGKTVFYGFLIWLILYFIGFFLLTFVPGTKEVIILIITILLVYSFSRIVINEKNMFKIGVTWFVVSQAMNLILMLVGVTSYYSVWSTLMVYFILIAEPSVIKYLSR